MSRIARHLSSCSLLTIPCSVSMNFGKSCNFQLVALLSMWFALSHLLCVQVPDTLPRFVGSVTCCLSRGNSFLLKYDTNFFSPTLLSFSAISCCTKPMMERVYVGVLCQSIFPKMASITSILSVSGYPILFCICLFVFSFK